MDQDNRESWLNRAAVGMAPLFEALDTPLYGEDRAQMAEDSGRAAMSDRRAWADAARHARL